MDNRILVVDDEVGFAHFMGEIAERCGYEAHATTNGDDFIRAFATFNPTLIVLDLVMPGIDGVELLRFLEESQCKAGILIVSGADDRLRQSIARLGIARGLRVLGTMPKPVRAAMLQDLFEKLRADDADTLDPGDVLGAELSLSLSRSS